MAQESTKQGAGESSRVGYVVARTPSRRGRRASDAQRRGAGRPPHDAPVEHDIGGRRLHAVVLLLLCREGRIGWRPPWDCLSAKRGSATHLGSCESCKLSAVLAAALLRTFRLRYSEGSRLPGAASSSLSLKPGMALSDEVLAQGDGMALLSLGCCVAAKGAEAKLACVQS